MHIWWERVHASSVTVADAIDGGEARFDPAVLAQAYLDLHHRFEGEWQHELLRDWTFHSPLALRGSTPSAWSPSMCCPR